MLSVQKLCLPLLISLSLGLSACAEEEEISLPQQPAKTAEPASAIASSPVSEMPDTASDAMPNAQEEHNTFEAKSGFPTDCTAYMENMSQCINQIASTNRETADQFQETLNNSMSDWRGMDYEAATTACRQANEFFQKKKTDLGC